MVNYLNKLNTSQILTLSLAAVYIFFGLLKVIDMSPVKDVVQQSLFLFEYDLVFALFGLAEVALGAMLLYRPLRALAAAGIVLHLLGTIGTALLNPHLTFASDTVVTVHGEFVFKNFVLIAAALHILKLHYGQVAAKSQTSSRA